MLIDSLKKLDMPENIGTADRVIEEVERHDLAKRIHSIHSALMGVVNSLNSAEIDPEEQTKSQVAINAVGVGLQRYIGDHMLHQLRNRDTVVTLMTQLSEAVRILTTVGSLFELNVDEESVQPTNDFSKWKTPKLKRLAAHMDSYANFLKTQHTSDEERVRNLTKVVDSMKTAETKSDDRSKNEASIAQGEIARQKEAIMRLQSILSAHVDQSLWVVARIDDTTKKPKRFYYEDEKGVIRNTKFVENAFVKSKKKAKYIRYEVQLHLQEKARRNEVRMLVDNVVIMQLSLFQLDLAADYDEE